MGWCPRGALCWPLGAPGVHTPVTACAVLLGQLGKSHPCAWHLPPCQSQSHVQSVGKNKNSAKVKAVAATIVATAPLATPSGPRPAQESRDQPSQELKPIPIVSLWAGVGGGGASVTGPQVLFCRPSVSQLLLPAQRSKFQRPLRTSGNYLETQRGRRGRRKQVSAPATPVPLPPRD